MKPLVPLTDEQLAVVQATRGPVRILAGAGTGKTTTIAHRIAAQVEGGEFDATEIVAVTFTKGAAHEMGRRLEELKVDGVRVGTFHSVAWTLVRARWQAWQGKALPTVLPSKVDLLARCVPAGTPALEILPDIDWLKRRRATPATAESVLSAAGRRTRLGNGETARVLARYEKRKRGGNLVDFEDLLELCIQLLREDDSSNTWFRRSFRAFTVDEFQDVDPLQNDLLVEWVGDSEEICVVGDSLQAIYGFRGGSHEYLEQFPVWQPKNSTFRLTTNFRSTSEVLRIANIFADTLPGDHPPLTSGASGPSPVVHGQTSQAKETSALIAAIDSLSRQGMPHSEMAILYRTNAQSTRFEVALTGANIPHRIIDTPFLRRLHVLKAVQEIAGAADQSQADVTLLKRVAKVRKEAVTEDEMSDADDLDALLQLWRDYGKQGTADPAGFRTWVEGQTQSGAQGVVLSTYHRAKGLEFDAVFLPALQQGTLPFYLAIDPEAIQSERRLFYVGLTRARRHLHLSWAISDAFRNPRSLFVEDLLPHIAVSVETVGKGTTSRTATSEPVRLSPAGQSMDSLTSEVVGRAFTSVRFASGRWILVELRLSLPCPSCGSVLRIARRPSNSDDTPLFALICGECRDIYLAAEVGQSDGALDEALAP